MRKWLRKKWGSVGVAALLFSFVVSGWSFGQENAERAEAEGAGSPSVSPAPEAPEAAAAVVPKPEGLTGLNTVVAMVNGEGITLDELQSVSNATLAAEKPKWSPKDWTRVEQIILWGQLENIIDKKLILMEAKELGARIDESRVREYIMSLPELKNSYDGDLAKFLADKEMSYSQLCKEIEELLLFKGMVRQKVLPKVHVPPGEVRQYYERNIAKFTQEAAIHCFAIVFLRRDTPEATAAVLTKAREALRKINGGAYFPDVAKEYSEDPRYADKGGDWGWITPGTLEKKASDAAFALKDGEYSGLVEGDAAYWLLWVKERRGKSVIPLSAAWKEIELGIKARKETVEIRKWGRRLRLKAAITYPVPLSEIVRR